MRIVAGRWRGRRIDAPAGEQVRPTSDRVREAWMSIVGPRLVGARVLDLFAGSGALGIEAVSRGAESADLVEMAPRSLAAIRANLAALGAPSEVTVHRADALRFVNGLAPMAYDIAFADPPYSLGLAPRLVEAWMAKPFARLLCVEHRFNEDLPPGGDKRRYGDTAISFFEAPPAADEGSF